MLPQRPFPSLFVPPPHTKKCARARVPKAPPQHWSEPPEDRPQQGQDERENHSLAAVVSTVVASVISSALVSSPKKRSHNYAQVATPLPVVTLGRSVVLAVVLAVVRAVVVSAAARVVAGRVAAVVATAVPATPRVVAAVVTVVETRCRRTRRSWDPWFRWSMFVSRESGWLGCRGGTRGRGDRGSFEGDGRWCYRVFGGLAGWGERERV